MNLVASSSLRPPTSGVRIHLEAITALVLVVAALAGCSASGDDDTSASDLTSATTSEAPATTTASTSSTAPAPPTAPRTETTEAGPSDVELTAAVEAFWDLYLEVGGSTAPFDPVAVRERLDERTSGEELRTLLDFFQSNALAGYVVRGDIDSSLTVLSATPSEAEVRDCYDDTTGLYRTDSGERLDTDNPARHQVVFMLVNDGGVWKVNQVRDEGDGCTISS